MAKFLKHLGIAKKPPPAPPTKDYEQSLYSNPSTSGNVKCTRFENSQSTPALLQEYTDPLDFRKESGFVCSADDENLYTNPTEEDVYSEPYENVQVSEERESQRIPFGNRESCVLKVSGERDSQRTTDGQHGSLAELSASGAAVVRERLSPVANGVDDFYDEVSTVDYPSELLEELAAGDESVEGDPDGLVAVEYDEPWEWGASPVASSTGTNGARPPVPDGSPLSSSGSSRCTGYPTLDYDGGSSGNLLDSESSLSFEFREDNDMPIRHLYETAFDSKVKREIEDIDRLTQSPVLRGESSSSTSSPGSAGRETRVRVKTIYNGNELAGGKISGSNGHHHRGNSRTRKSNGERISRSRTTEGIISVTDNQPLVGPPPELPKPRLPPSNSRIIPNFNQLKIEKQRRVTLLPDRVLPTQPSNKGVSPLTGPAPMKIQAVIENAPTSIRSSQSSSSTSSLEDNRILPGETFSCPSSKSMSALKPSMTNGNAANAKLHAALNDELSNVFKSKFKTIAPGSTCTTNLFSNRPAPSDNNNVEASVALSNGFAATTNSVCSTNGLSSSTSVPARNEICPKCCQPIVANSTPRRKSPADAQFESTSNQTLLDKTSDSASSQNVLLCKCSAVQSPENDIRPLAEYDLPWDVPKRFGPIVIGPLAEPGGSSGSSSAPENENEKAGGGNTRDELGGETEEETPIACSKGKAKENNPRRGLELNLPLSKDFKCLDFESNSAPAALNKMGAETKGNERVISITKSPSETQITHNDPIFESAKFKLPTGPATRKNLNLNFNTTNAPSNKNLRQGLGLNFGFSSLSARGESVDPSIPLEEQGWYHGSISRIDAENSLRVLKEGSYLVRNSESSKQDYSLSLKSARGFMHMKIVHNEGSYILGQFSKPFSSIPEMIHHYSNNKLPIRGAEHMSLLFPVIDQLL